MQHLYKIKLRLVRIINRTSTLIHTSIDYPSFLISSIKAKQRYSFIQKLGQGKDGVVFLCKHKNTDTLYVVKILSRYAKQFADLTKYISDLKITSPAFYNFELTDNAYISYPYEKLYDVKTDAKSFLQCLIDICHLEEVLSKNKVYYWDFGFQGKCNYLIDDTEQLKLIDYSGNGFLLHEAQPNMHIQARKNLVVASNDFLQIQLLLHIIYQALGRVTAVNYASHAQSASHEELLKIKNFCKLQLNGTIYQTIGEAILSQDLLQPKGWNALLPEIESTKAEGMEGTQENADVESVTYLQDGVKVIGYQSYEISHNQLTPISREEVTLWDTSKKFRLLNDALKQIRSLGQVNTFLDIGSNLGLYVFLARLNYNIPSCTGYDYNSSYIEICNSIKNHLNISGCNFNKVSFKNITENFDCVVAMAIIHHLYHRTEDYGSLDEIVKKFSQITNKYLIIEFPTENDPKAKKWTKMPGRNINEIYSEENFLLAVKKYFSSFHIIGHMSKNRITYLLIK